MLRAYSYTLLWLPRMAIHKSNPFPVKIGLFDFVGEQKYRLFIGDYTYLILLLLIIGTAVNQSAQFTHL